MGVVIDIIAAVADIFHMCAREGFLCGSVINIVAAVADIFHTCVSEGSCVGVSSMSLWLLPIIFTHARVRFSCGSVIDIVVAVADIVHMRMSEGLSCESCHQYRCSHCRHFSHAHK
jgi:hypothetical protein